jgi:hypothetical protein
LTELYEKEYNEYEEPMESLVEKAKIFTHYLREAKHAVVYTGAGIFLT